MTGSKRDELTAAARNALDALAVITRRSHIATYLATHDPKAFTQAKEALTRWRKFPASLDHATVRRSGGARRLARNGTDQSRSGK
jgi:hypothetical protein